MYDNITWSKNMNKIIKKIFYIEKEIHNKKENYIVNFLGFKIKYSIIIKENYSAKKQQEINFNILQNLIENNADLKVPLSEIVEKALSEYSIVSYTTSNYFEYLFKKQEYLQKYDNIKFRPINAFIWGSAPRKAQLNVANYALQHHIPLLKIEDGFIRSADTWSNKNADKKYVSGISFTFSDTIHYFDATRESRMEQLINDKTLVITSEQKKRARKCIDKIIETHLTKYNHQPIYDPKIGRVGVKKVLVVDQSFGDYSISRGLADENTFKEMLEAAIRENPDADIIVKTHPDTMVGAGGYYKGLIPHDNIYTQTEPINPISLIKYVDKVYVCSTQFGFEALMCNKEVHVFGMPFYAGWGLTKDRQQCIRRTNKRTLEELFYIAYIIYTYYVNPDKECRCEIEEAIDYLLKLREEYFKKYNVKSIL